MDDLALLEQTAKRPVDAVADRLERLVRGPTRDGPWCRSPLSQRALPPRPHTAPHPPPHRGHRDPATPRPTCPAGCSTCHVPLPTGQGRPPGRDGSTAQGQRRRSRTPLAGLPNHRSLLQVLSPLRSEGCPRPPPCCHRCQGRSHCRPPPRAPGHCSSPRPIRATTSPPFSVGRWVRPGRLAVRFAERALLKAFSAARGTSCRVTRQTSERSDRASVADQRPFQGKAASGGRRVGLYAGFCRPVASRRPGRRPSI